VKERGVAGERTADEIQRDIEQARVSLASAVDQLAYRTSPKRVVEKARRSVLERVQTTQGKLVIGGAGAVLTLLVIRRIAKRRT
jgi:hypothetical protein